MYGLAGHWCISRVTGVYGLAGGRFIRPCGSLVYTGLQVRIWQGLVVLAAIWHTDEFPMTSMHTD